MIHEYIKAQIPVIILEKETYPPVNKEHGKSEAPEEKELQIGIETRINLNQGS